MAEKRPYHGGGAGFGHGVSKAVGLRKNHMSMCRFFPLKKRGLVINSYQYGYLFCFPPGLFFFSQSGLGILFIIHHF